MQCNQLSCNFILSARLSGSTFALLHVLNLYSSPLKVVARSSRLYNTVVLHFVCFLEQLQGNYGLIHTGYIVFHCLCVQIPVPADRTACRPTCTAGSL